MMSRAELTEKANSYRMNGALIGAVGGGAIGYFAPGTKFFTVMIGSIAGAIIGLMAGYARFRNETESVR